MADKQIIINGCDVSGCDFYDKNKKYCLTLKMNTTGFKNPSCFSGDFQECIQDSKVCSNTFCDNNHNCYYKQLQQLKAENEELKKLNEQLVTYYPQENNELLKVKLENEELNRKLKIAYTAETFVKTQKEHTQLDRKIDKYKLCLDEIIEQIESIEATAGSIFEDNCITLSRAISKYSRNILQLIKQAKEVEE